MPPPNEVKPSGMSPVEVIIDVFGSVRAVARVLDVEPSTVMGWKNSRKRSDGYRASRPTGRVPHQHMRTLLDAAAKSGKRLTLEEVVWGRGHVTRTVITFDAPGPLGQMAKALTRFGCPA